MLLVVDANILMSALISRGVTLDLLFSDKLQLIVPDWIFVEIDEHREEVLEKSTLTKEEFELFINLIITRLEIVPAEEFKMFLEEADKFSPDPDDVVYFALALKFGCPVWSNDSKLKEQPVVKVFTTEELLSIL